MLAMNWATTQKLIEDYHFINLSHKWKSNDYKTSKIINDDEDVFQKLHKRSKQYHRRKYISFPLWYYRRYGV